MDECIGYSYDSTSIRRPFDCLSKAIKITMTNASLAADMLAAVTLTYLLCRCPLGGGIKR